MQSGQTLVFYMGLEKSADIQIGLVGAGLNQDFPVAVITHGCSPQQQVHVTQLNQLNELSITLKGISSIDCDGRSCQTARTTNRNRTVSDGIRGNMSSILECIRTVGRGERGRKPLNFDQAFRVMDEYLNGECDDDQMAMLLMLIRVQNETQQEIAGFVKAFQSRMPAIGADIDWPCYAGKREAAGQPWHLLAAKILADNGHKVLMHGYHDRQSGRLHAEDYLDKFAIEKAESAEEAKRVLETQNIVYLPLSAFAPQAETMIGWKNRYG